jgi:glycogen debranching enzyme
VVHASHGTAQDLVHVLQGSAFMLSDPAGDIDEGSVAGLFHEDTRFLNRFVLEIEGESGMVLSTSNADYNAAAFFLTTPPLPNVPAESLSVQRYRSIDETVNEVILIQNHLSHEVSLSVRLTCGSDFADLFEVKDIQIEKRGRLTTQHDPGQSVLLFDYRNGEFHAATRVHSSEPAVVDGDSFVFELVLQPREIWKTRINVAFSVGGAFRPLVFQEREASRVLRAWRESDYVQQWREEAPKLETDWDVLKLVYERSVVDLTALRLHATVQGNKFSLPAAGLPWFMAIFGRDTLICAYQSLFIGPELARGALNTLGALQGTEVNEFKDEEPGKILHEIRFGELTVLGDKPHRPYYGSADATPLFLVLLSEYWRVTRDDATVLGLRTNALRALEWIDSYGDLDGDGFVEYSTRSSQGLENQGWKDSWDGVPHTDGTAAKLPISLCEIQGYVYDAKQRAAELADEVWDNAALAQKLRREADALREKFNENFWIDDRGGFYALALDGEKRRVGTIASNMGHLLWSGIVPADRAPKVVRQLLSPAMWTGWGIRTLSADEAAYNPIRYHNGTVWPHDNSIISAGFQRYGYRDEAMRVAVALIEAAAHTDYRLPEVFAGYPRSDSRVPVRYPTACSPQAWATAAPFLWLRLILGLEIENGTLTASPVDRFRWLALRGVHALGRRFDVASDGVVIEADVPVAG